MLWGNDYCIGLDHFTIIIMHIFYTGWGTFWGKTYNTTSLTTTQFYGVCHTWGSCKWMCRPFTRLFCVVTLYPLLYIINFRCTWPRNTIKAMKKFNHSHDRNHIHILNIRLYFSQSLSFISFYKWLFIFLMAFFTTSSPLSFSSFPSSCNTFCMVLNNG